jgi:hypothetical protein
MSVHRPSAFGVRVRRVTGIGVVARRRRGDGRSVHMGHDGLLWSGVTLDTKRSGAKIAAGALALP